MNLAPNNRKGLEALAIIAVRLISPDGTAFRDRDIEDEITACYFLAADKVLAAVHGADLLKMPIAVWYDDREADRQLMPLARSEGGAAARQAIKRMLAKFEGEALAKGEPFDMPRAFQHYFGDAQLNGLANLKRGKRVARDAADLATAVAVALLEAIGVSPTRGENLRKTEPTCGCALIAKALGETFQVRMAEENATDIWWSNRDAGREIAPAYFADMQAAISEARARGRKLARQ